MEYLATSKLGNFVSFATTSHHLLAFMFETHSSIKRCPRWL